MSQIPKINPFERPVIDDPREATQTVDSIHRGQLDKILSIFASLENQAIPRLGKGPLTVRLLSEVPGCGKSHLLGRVWHALDDRATLIYLRANQDRFNLWKRMLERSVQELEYPDDSRELVLKQGTPSQLDCIARHIIGDLITRAAKNGDLQWDTEDPKALEADPVGVIGKEDNRKDLRENLDKLLPILIARLTEVGLKLEAGARAWLTVLTYYTINEAGDPDRALAVSWMQGCSLDHEDAKKIGLSAHEVPTADLSEDGRNEEAFRRLKDICAIGSFFRPFVFAFDQTELYNQSSELAKGFGATLSRLQAQCVNQLTLVTANYHIWLSSIFKNFEDADQQRFFHEIIDIKGINGEQAQQLVTTKLLAANYSREETEVLVKGAWLTDLYKTKILPSARVVEQAAGKALLSRSTKEGDKAKQPVPLGPKPLSEVFEEYRLRILKTPKATDFDASVLHWVLTIGLQGLPDVSVDTRFRSAKGYLNVRWEVGDKHTLFLVLNDSNVWIRWQAIVTEFKNYARKESAKNRSSRAIALWHARMKKIGDGMRKRVTEGAQMGFQMMVISDEEAAELYAGQSIAADIRQGDLKPYTDQELITFLGRRLGHWKRRFWAPEEAPELSSTTSGNTELAPVIKSILRNAKGLSWTVLQRRLKDKEFQVTVEQALVACQQLADDVKIFSTPTNHFFLWQRKSG